MQKIKIELRLENNTLDTIRKDYIENGRDLSVKYPYKEAFELYIIRTVHRLVDTEYGEKQPVIVSGEKES